MDAGAWDASLDAAIEAGDWDAVGQIASLLSDTSVASSNTGGVVVTAKFEAAEASAGRRSSIDYESIDTGTPGTGSAATPSVETSVSDSASKVQRRAEVRAKVEALVRHVVPEEIGNVDEMMNQFKGREEELVEMLRTMQDRSVAQKARAAGQKADIVRIMTEIDRGDTNSDAAAAPRKERQPKRSGGGEARHADEQLAAGWTLHTLLRDPNERATGWKKAIARAKDPAARHEARVKDDRGNLPLHVACSFRAPLEVAEALLGAYPEAVSQRNIYGNLPLHFTAWKKGPLDVVRLLLKMLPEGASQKNNHRNLPLHYATHYSAPLDVVAALYFAYPKGAFRKNTDNNTPIDLVRAGGESSNVIALFQGQQIPPTEKAILTVTTENTIRDPGESTPQNTQPESVTTTDKLVDFASEKNESIVEDTGKTIASTLPSQEEDLNAEEAVREHGGNRAPNPSPESAAALVAAADLHRHDRGRLRSVIEHTSNEPASVSGTYVQSILTDSFLGHGYFGTVFKGKDSMLAREFAIKSINPEILRGGTKQDIEKAMKTFKTEQEALSRFRHQNIAALFAYSDPLLDENGGSYYLVYELAEKGSLDTFLVDDVGRSRIGSFSRRVKIAVDVFTAIRFLHVGNDEISSCLHRDVKAANIVIKRNFTAQLIDCGIAKFLRDDDCNPTSTGIKGTPGYLCPDYGAGGVKYDAACDIYSFGVVLAELWTGRLQNYKDESGAPFHFGKHYVLGRRGKRREILQDVDETFDCDAPLPDHMRQFAALALSCMAHDIEDRPEGQEVLKALRLILEACATESDFADLSSRSDPQSIDLCRTCRTFPNFHPYKSCLMCIVREEAGNAISQALLNWLTPLTATVDLNKRIEDLGKKIDPQLEGLRRQVGDVNRKLDLALPVLAHLDMRLNNQVPRTFLLVPADIKSGWQRPRSWLRSTVQRKYYLYFVCPVSQQVAWPPIKLKAAKDWFRKAAPVLATGLLLVQIALKAGLNVSLALDGASADLFDVSAVHIAEMLHELAVILDESNNSELLDRLRSKQLSEEDVRELSGDAYELVVEKACEQRGWRSQMEPVRVPPSPKVFWVAKAVAADPKYEILKA